MSEESRCSLRARLFLAVRVATYPLKALDNFRKALLAHADSLNDLLFKRRMAGKNRIPARPPAGNGLPFLPAPNVKIPLRPPAAAQR